MPSLTANQIPRIAAALALVGLLGGAHPASAQSPAAGTKTFDITRLIPPNDPTYVRADKSQSWSTSFRGKNSPNIQVTIVGAQDPDFPPLVLFIVVIGARTEMPLSRNLLLKLLELNSDYDYAKITLSDENLNVRVDYPLAGLDSKRVEDLASGLATAADTVFGEIKNFAP